LFSVWASLQTPLGSSQHSPRPLAGKEKGKGGKRKEGKGKGGQVASS